MADQQSVQDHYGLDDLTTRLEQALGDGGLDWKSLAPFDQFHVGGLGSCRDLSAALAPEPGSTILDIGSGLGGPARFLAANYDCHVTGIDLSPSFVNAAQMLSERVGLADRTTFVAGDALDLPFPDASFDHAWTLHVAMNIADRAGLYAEIYRVLKPGGRLAIYDVLAGDNQPLIFPVPWAGDPSISFLLTPEAMREALTTAGFEEISWTETTEGARASFDSSQASAQGLSVTMGPDFPRMVANLARNLQEGRARVARAVVRKP